MPLDKEIHLGFIGPVDCLNALQAMGLKAFDDDNQPIETIEDLRNHADFAYIEETSVAPLLKKAYLDIAARFGWSLIGPGQHTDFLFETPFGKRHTDCFQLSFQHDGGEVGDEPDDITFGINLSTRYRTILLDAPNESLGTIVDMEEMLPLAQICREEASKQLPIFSKARIFTRDIFY